MTLYNDRQALVERISNDIAKQMLDHLANSEAERGLGVCLYESSGDITFIKPISKCVMEMIEGATEFKLISSGVLNEVKMKKKNALTIHYKAKGRRMKQSERSQFGLDDSTVEAAVEAEDPTPTD